MSHKLSLPLALLLGFSTSVAFASAPSGVYTYHFDPTNIALWDVSGTYHLSPEINGDTPVDFDVTVVQDSQGKLYGAGQTSVDIDGETVVGNYILKGKVTTSGTVTRVSASVKLTGIGMLQGANRAYSLSETYVLELDSTGLTAAGLGKGSAKAQGLGSGKITEEINESLPEEMTGSWKLDLGVDTNVKKLFGNSTLTLSNNRSLDFVTGGSYSSKTDLSKVKLSGIGSGAGSKFNFVGDGDVMVGHQFTGKVLGQTIKY
jgi:hypothetical protein